MAADLPQSNNSASPATTPSVFGTRHRSAAAAAAAAAVDRATLVTFTVGDDTLAAPVESVERVVRFAQPSPIPGMPDWLEGVIEYRGVMVPVIDLRRRFGRERLSTGATTRVVVFNTQPDWLAAIVDAVTEVVTVDASAIAPPPALVRGLSGAYLMGMVKHRDQVVLVLDVGKVLTASESLTLESMSTASGESADAHATSGSADNRAISGSADQLSSRGSTDQRANSGSSDQRTISDTADERATKE